MHGKDAAHAFIQRIHLPVLMEPGNEEMIVIPFPLGDGSYLHLRLHIDDDADQAMFDALICRVAPGRRKAVAVILADLNRQRAFVTWSLQQNQVILDLCIDLDNVCDLELAIGRGFTRLIPAITEGRDRLLRASTSRRCQRRRRREFEEIVQALMDLPNTPEG